MLKLICTALVLIAMTGTARADGLLASRDQLVSTITSPAFGLVASDSFEETTDKNGAPLFRSMGKNGVMVSLMGPQDDVAEVFLMVGLSQDNAFEVMALAAAITSQATGDDDASTWTLAAIQKTAATNGGKMDTTINGKTVEVTTFPPNFLTLSVHN